MKPITNPQKHVLQMMADGALVYCRFPHLYEWASGHNVHPATMQRLISDHLVEITVGGTLGAAVVAYRITNKGREAINRQPVCDSCGEAETLYAFNEQLYGRGFQMYCGECYEIAHDYEQELLLEDISLESDSMMYPLPGGAQ